MDTGCLNCTHYNPTPRHGNTGVCMVRGCHYQPLRPLKDVAKPRDAVYEVGDWVLVDTGARPEPFAVRITGHNRSFAGELLYFCNGPELTTQTSARSIVKLLER